MSLLTRKKAAEDEYYLQTTQIIGGFLGIAWHTMYLIVFNIFDITWLFRLNLFFSVPAWICALALTYKGYLRIGAIIVGAEIVIHQVIAVLMVGQDSLFHLMLFNLIPVGLMSRNIRRTFPIYSLLAISLFLAVLWFDTGQYVQYQLDEKFLKFLQFASSLGLFAVVGPYVFYYVSLNRKLLAKQKETSNQLSNAHSKLNLQHMNITDSIRYAERIQAAVLPPQSQFSDSLADFFILFLPRDIVSGDFFWTHTKEDKFIVALGDCTGHGVPGALLSMLGISFLNEIVINLENIRANEILDRLREYLITSLHQEGNPREAKDGIEIALCVFNEKKDKLEFAGANRPLYLVRENFENGVNESKAYQLFQYSPDRMPIGIHDQKMVPFTNQVIELVKNDSLYLFSDGYVDQMGGPSRKTFKSHRFRKLLLEIQDLPMESQKQVLFDQYQSWKGNNEQIDDIVVMGIKL